MSLRWSLPASLDPPPDAWTSKTHMSTLEGWFSPDTWGACAPLVWDVFLLPVLFVVSSTHPWFVKAHPPQGSVHRAPLSPHLLSTWLPIMLAFVLSHSLWPMDCSPPGSLVHGVLQARILEWVAISFSRGSSRPRDWTHVSCISCIAGRFFASEATREVDFLYTGA